MAAVLQRYLRDPRCHDVERHDSEKTDRVLVDGETLFRHDPRETDLVQDGRLGRCHWGGGMRNFLKVAEGLDVLPLLLSLQLQPELWNRDSLRKEAPGTPHSAMDDIWVRFAKGQEDFPKPHFAEWYPAYYRLPALRQIIFALMARVEATHLGGVLITRIPPGGVIEPHVDTGWHPEFYNCKLYVVLQSNPQCVFRVEDEKVAMRPGDVWRVDNTKEHEVVNAGETERMTLIICARCE
jgi:mannose-6-phosphate isomerase-like protein (cupin superfamily)